MIKSFGNKYYVTPGFLVFSWNIKAKSDFITSLISQSKQNSCYARSNTQI
jgi:hypothetical protein